MKTKHGIGLALILSSCVHSQAVVPQSPQSQLAAIERLAETSPSAATEGQAALANFIIDGNPARATPWITKALAEDPFQSDALYSRLLIARESLNDRQEAETALMILQHTSKGNPNGLADLAAFRLREVAGVSPAIDLKIVDALSGLHSGPMQMPGTAAFRAREVLAGIHEAHNDDELLGQTRADLGTPTSWTVVGPLQALRTRDFEKPDPFDDPAHVLTTGYTGPLGSIAPRVFETPGGTLDMEHDSFRADVYEALTDVDAKFGGKYLLSIRGASELRVFVDGTQVVERRSMPVRPPERTWAGVELTPGRHRLRVKFARVEAGWFSLLVPRMDGAPSDLAFSTPAVGSSGQPQQTVPFSMPAPTARPGDPVSMFLTVQNLAMDDGDAARDLFEELLASDGDSPTVRSMDADLTTGDSELPRANIVGRVSQDLDFVLKALPGNARALLGRFQQERNDKRYEPAEARLALLTAVVGESQPRVLVERARFALDRGNAAQAREFLDSALKLDPGRCDALSERTSLARRDYEEALTRRLVPILLACPGGVGVNAQFLRSAGKTSEALPLLRRMLARNPSSASARKALADALYAEGDAKAAAELVEPLVALWPHDNDALKRLGAWRELSGDEPAANDFLRQALARDGSDLALQRSLAAKTNEEVLGWAARDGLAAIAEYKKTDFPTTASAVQVLDFGVLEILRDGSSLERVQSVVQVLDKRGIGQYGEVNIPGDAQPLIVRTIKADGRILDAEAISGKEGISLPNLEPGDFAEYSFVRAQPPRAAAMAGWSGGQFMFQADDIPFFESTYIVRAPASIGMEIDQANIEDVPRIERNGDTLTLTYSRHRMEPHLPEPFSVADLEVVPWLEAGIGAGQEALPSQLSDWVPARARVSRRVRDFVRGTVQLPPKARVAAIVDRVRAELHGDSNSMDFSDSAGTILARKRGNRMLVLKAALAAAGIQSHIALARPFNEYPHEFRFPHAASYRSALLRIEPPGSPPLWIDFTLREAPLGHLPSVLSGQEAYVVPNNAAEPIEHLHLPEMDAFEDRTDSTMDFALDADGTLTGKLTQSAYGFDAAALRWRFDQINMTELRKAQERQLSRTFRGVTLTDFSIQDSGDPRTPVVAVSTIRVPGYAEKRGSANVIPSSFGLLEMGRRFIGRADRKTPMLLSSDDVSISHATVHVPAGVKVDPPVPVDVETAFGKYRSKWTFANGQLSQDEEFTARRGRVTPEKYASFKAFAAAVDAAQGREITLQ